MIGLTKTGSCVLDCHDSGMPPHQIALVLGVPVGDVLAVIRRYMGTADDGDVLDELLPDATLTPAPQIGGWLL